MDEEKEVKTSSNDKDKTSNLIQDNGEKSEGYVGDTKDNKKEEEKRKKEIKKQNKQLLYAIFLMVAVLLIIFLVPVIRGYMNHFVYINLDFYKTKMGELTFYSVRVPVTKITGEIIGSYDINFRNDPRELEHIPVNIPENKVTFKKADEIYISLDPEAPICEYNVIAVAGLTGFLKDFGAMDVRGAFSDEIAANESNTRYVTCENSPENTVIYLNSGDSTEIKKLDENCYELTYKECEMLQVTEKFQLVVLEYYMSYFVRED